MMADPGRRPPPDRADGGADDVDAPDTVGEVVDLRAPTASEPGEVDPDVVAPPEVPETVGDLGNEPPPARSDRPSSRLAARIRRSLYPAVAVLLASSLVVLVAAERGAAARRTADAVEARVASELELGGRLESLWIDVLAVVAGGVGQRVSSADAAVESLGSLRGTLEAADGDPSPTVPGALADVRSQQRASVEVFAEALDRTAGDPVELGNELEVLAEAQASFAESSTDALGILTAESDAATRRADRWFVLSVVAAVLGLVLAVAAGLSAVRRWRAGLDDPLDSMVDGLAGVPEPLGRAAYPEIVEVAANMERALRVAREDTDRLRRQAARDEWTRGLSEALDLVDDEAEVHRVVGRALTRLDAGRPVELLLSERGSARLSDVASDQSHPGPGCPVDAVGACVAIRRGQVSRFDDSRSLNACPYLADRPYGPCSATCVPVTVATRPVGVLHMTGEPGQPPPNEVVEQLVSISTQVGARLSGLRTLETSRHEASTDGLTGLPNRRALETEVAELVDRGTPFIMVIADLDKFKVLNDTFGHEIGDKALQLFAGVLRDNVRGNDVVARLGGEEFVLVYPNMTVETSVEAIGRLRQALERAVKASSVPPFTCSFGIAHSSVAADGDAVLRVADAGLLQAKELGGDQVVVADPDVMSQVFSDGGSLHGRRDESSD